ncbi:MAG: hypothetical protein ABIQ89_04340 [Candidatus Saccharimonadales bacterium]
MSKVRVVVIVIAVIATATLAVVAASRLAQTQLHKNKLSRQQCAKVTSNEYTVTIQDNQTNPNHVQAKQCDRLTVINRDDTDRLMAFGVQEAHIVYDEISEKRLNKDESFTVILVQTGDFKVHDHDDDKVKATFTVKPL